MSLPQYFEVYSFASQTLKLVTSKYFTCKKLQAIFVNFCYKSLFGKYRLTSNGWLDSLHDSKVVTRTNWLIRVNYLRTITYHFKLGWTDVDGRLGSARK